MTCVRTGCHIYLDHYGLFAYGDAHEVGGAFFFRLVKTSSQPIHSKLHYELANHDSWWDTTAHTSTLVADASFVLSYGYDGTSVEDIIKVPRNA